MINNPSIILKSFKYLYKICFYFCKGIFYIFYGLGYIYYYFLKRCLTNLNEGNFNKYLQQLIQLNERKTMMFEFIIDILKILEIIYLWLKNFSLEIYDFMSHHCNVIGKIMISCIFLMFFLLF